MSDFALEYEYLLDKNLEYQVIDAGVRNVTFTSYTTEEPTTRVERYIKLRIVDNSKPDEPSTTEPTTGTVEPSTSATEETTQPATQATEQTKPTQLATKPSDAPVATGENAFAYCVPALLMLGAISVIIYTKRKSSENK